MSIFCKCFPYVTSSVLTSLISALQEIWSESNLSSQSTEQKQTPRGRGQERTLETNGREMQSGVKLYKAPLFKNELGLLYHRE